MAGRRQNSSCDQCRRAKRKCFVLHIGNSRDSSSACNNCQRLRRTCTFNFVANTAHRKQERPNASLNVFEPPQEFPWGHLPSDPAHTLPHHEILHQAAQPYTEHVTISEPSPEFCIGLDDLDVSSGSYGLDGFDSCNRLCSSLPVEKPTKSSQLGVTLSLHGFTQTRQSVVGDLCSIGSWNGSPIRLLNSTFNVNLVGQVLNGIYASMMSGMEDRYLAHTCNPFATQHAYCFAGSGRGAVASSRISACGREKISSSTTPTKSSLTVQGAPCDSISSSIMVSSPASAETNRNTTKLTFIGLVRFLDHFGELYGNRIEKHDRQKDQDLVIAAQRAYALQWSSCKPPGHTSQVAMDKCYDACSEYNVFTTAWFDVRSRLLASEGHLSFLRIYASLLFDMTSAPREAVNAEIERQVNFDRALHQFVCLKGLVETYCQQLSTESTYRALLDSSIRLFYWFAFFKDTMATIINGRETVLPDDQMQPIGQQTRTTRNGLRPDNPIEDPSLSLSACTAIDANRPFDDEQFSIICQNAALCAFRLFRHLTKIKSLLRSPHSGEVQTEVRKLCNRSTKIIESFESEYECFCISCIEDFAKFSQRSQLSFGYMLLFWTLAVLSFIDEVERICHLGHISADDDLMHACIRYEATAINLSSRIVQKIIELSKNGPMEVAGNTTLMLPFISQHANTEPIVEVLVKTIEHTIRHHTLRQRHDNEQSQQNRYDQEKDESFFQEFTIEQPESNPPSPVPPDDWILSIKALMSCLFELETTLGGTLIVRKTIQRLMRDHGDILMECWVVDDV